MVLVKVTDIFLPPALKEQAFVNLSLVAHQPRELGKGLFTLVTGECLLAPVLLLFVSPHLWPGAALEATDLVGNLVLAAVLLAVLLKTVLNLEGGVTEQDAVLAAQMLHLGGH